MIHSSRSRIPAAVGERAFNLFVFVGSAWLLFRIALWLVHGCPGAAV